LDRGEVQWHFPAKGSGVLARDVRDPSQSPRHASHRLSVKESTGALSEDGRTLGGAVPAPGRGSGAQSCTQCHSRRVVASSTPLAAAVIISPMPEPSQDLDFLAHQELVDGRAPPEYHPIGQRVEIARGEDWSVMAWRTKDGFCIAHAPQRWGCSGRAIGRLPDRATGRHTSSLSSALLQRTGEGAA
jgi:hypothetical protein